MYCKRIAVYWYGNYRQSASNKFGVLNEKGDTIVPIIYDEISLSGQARFIVQQEGRYGVLDMQGEEVIPVRYDRISVEQSMFLVRSKLAQYNYELAIFDACGDLLLPFVSTKTYTNGPYYIYNGSVYLKSTKALFDKAKM